MRIRVRISVGIIEMKSEDRKLLFEKRFLFFEKSNSIP